MIGLVVARSSHEIPDRAPIRLEVGDSVEIGTRNAEWPVFVFVTTTDGSGWVPERHLERQGTTGTVIEPYDTTELPVDAGEELEIVRPDSLSGWLWCRAKSGREGWVPERSVFVECRSRE